MTKFGIEITMIGDVGTGSKGTLVQMYRRTRVPLEKARASQDFCATRLGNPTTFASKDFADDIAGRVVYQCNKLHQSLREIGIMRHFIVRVKPMEDAE